MLREGLGAVGSRTEVAYCSESAASQRILRAIFPTQVYTVDRQES